MEPKSLFKPNEGESEHENDIALCCYFLIQLFSLSNVKENIRIRIYFRLVWTKHKGLFTLSKGEH